MRAKGYTGSIFCEIEGPRHQLYETGQRGSEEVGCIMRIPGGQGLEVEFSVT
jgi:hypothetical protein